MTQQQTITTPRRPLLKLRSPVSGDKPPARPPTPPPPPRPPPPPPAPSPAAAAPAAPARLSDPEEVLELLADRWPACFNLHVDGPRRPLKIGINRDLVAAQVLELVSSRGLNLALTLYCHHDLYLCELQKPGIMRIDLDGNEVEPVTEQAAMQAAAMAAAHQQRRRQQVKP